MNCPHCYAPLTADARFCPGCGKATAPTESGASWPIAASAPDLTGHEIVGRYRILKKIGEGGMGAVYRGEQISLKRPVAVKLLRPELGTNQLLLRRFNAEAEAVAKLSHPNTVNIYDFGQDRDGSLFIAMEFIEGRSLREAIQREAPFSPTRALTIAAQVAASLSDAHTHSIVHRDLKPDNVMLQDRGKQRDVVRVLDFGIAKLRDDSRATQQAMTQAGDMLGTPQYMAPEQIRGEVIDGRADIYALGCLIYEMLTARLPFEAPTIVAMLSKHLTEQPPPPSQRRPDLRIPPTLDELVMRALVKEPASRPPTMETFAEMIASGLATLPRDPNASAGMSAPVGMSTQPGPGVGSPGPGFASPVPRFASPAPGMAAISPPPGVQAVGPSWGVPPTTAAAAPTPAPASYAPPAISPTVAIPAAGKRKSMPLYIVLGVLAVAGAGAGVWAWTRGQSTDNAKPASDNKQHDVPEHHEPVQPDKPDQPDQWDTKSDPWADHTPKANGGADGLGNSKALAPPPPPTRKPAPMPRPQVGTGSLPKGIRIRAPEGFIENGNDSAKVWINANTSEMIAMVALPAGANEAMIEQWAKTAGAAKGARRKVTSAGKPRDAIWFSRQEADGTGFGQVVVFYVEPRYSVVVYYQAPKALFNDEAVQQRVAAFFARDVIMP